MMSMTKNEDLGGTHMRLRIPYTTDSDWIYSGLTYFTTFYMREYSFFLLQNTIPVHRLSFFLVDCRCIPHHVPYGDLMPLPLR